MNTENEPIMIALAVALFLAVGVGALLSAVFAAGIGIKGRLLYGPPRRPTTSTTT